MRDFLRLKLVEVYFLTIAKLSLALCIWTTLGDDLWLSIACPVAFFTSKALFGSVFARLPDAVTPRALVPSLVFTVLVGFSLFVVAFSASIWELFIISCLLFGVADSYFSPTVNAMVPVMVAEMDVPQAYRLSFFLSSFGTVAGLMLGFLGYELLAGGLVLAGLFCISIIIAVTTVGVRPFPLSRLAAAAQSPHKGLARFAQVPFEIEWSIVSLLINTVTVSFATFVIPLTAKTAFQTGPTFIGLLEGSVTLGVVCGALIVHKWVSERMGDIATVLVSLALLGMAMLVYALVLIPWVWVIVSFVVGVVIVTNNTTIEARRAVALPPDERGYFQTVHFFIIQAGVPIGLLLSSIGALEHSLTGVLLVSAAIIVGCTVWLGVSPQFRAFVSLPRDQLLGFYERSEAADSRGPKIL